MKRLALLVMIPALAIFMVATMASAEKDGWGAIQGIYAMTGTGNCLWAVAGFDDDLNALAGKPVFSSHFGTQGYWEFWRNGRGHTTYTQFGFTAPGPSLPPLTSPNAASLQFDFDFEYTVTHDGLITVEMLPETFQGNFLTGPNANLDPPKTFKIDNGTFVGSVSSDHKTLTLTGENDLTKLGQYQGQNPDGSPKQVSECPVICNSGRVLIRVSE